jgi:hypothetical protein
MMCCNLVHELSHELPKTTKDLLNIATRHSSGDEAVGAAFTLVSAGMAAGGGWATPTSTIVRSTKKGAKGEKKGKKHRPCRLATMASNGDAGEEFRNSDKEFVAPAECHFKRHTRLPKDSFEKILEAACPHHPYPVKHKLRDYTMIKKFMTSGAPLVATSRQETRKERVQLSFPGRQKS